MRTCHALAFGLFACLGLSGQVRAYNILSLDTGGYWNNLSDQYFGAQEGFGAPGLPGERWFTRVDYQELATADLMQYDVFLVQSAFTDDGVLIEASDALAALNAKAPEINEFLRAGNGLVAWSEPLPDGATHSWDWSPVSLSSQGTSHENPVEITDPSHPMMAHSSDESLSDWHSSWHGWFDSWDARLTPLARTGDFGQGDPRTHQALTLGGSYWGTGSGRMVFSMQDADYHAYQGFTGAQTLMRDALDWSAPMSPVPEPKTAMLLVVGLGGLALAAARRRPR